MVQIVKNVICPLGECISGVVSNFSIVITLSLSKDLNVQTSIFKLNTLKLIQSRNTT